MARGHELSIGRTIGVTFDHASTGPSSTGAVNCLPRSTLLRPRPPPLAASVPSSAGPPSRPTSPTHRNAEGASPHASDYSNSGCPKSSASRHGGSLGSAPVDVEQLNKRIVHLEQQFADLRLQLDECTDELAAARATNRQLMTSLNTRTTAGSEAI